MCCLAFDLARLPAIAFQVLPYELHASDHSTASLPVCRLTVTLARLPAIAFQVLLDAGAVVASWLIVSRQH